MAEVTINLTKEQEELLLSKIPDEYVCEECGGKVVRTSGCEQCLVCGTSSCG